MVMPPGRRSLSFHINGIGGIARWGNAYLFDVSVTPDALYWGNGDVILTVYGPNEINVGTLTHIE